MVCWVAMKMFFIALKLWISHLVPKLADLANPKNQTIFLSFWILNVWSSVLSKEKTHLYEKFSIVINWTFCLGAPEYWYIEYLWNLSYPLLPRWKRIRRNQWKLYANVDKWEKAYKYLGSELQDKMWDRA